MNDDIKTSLGWPEAPGLPPQRPAHDIDLVGQKVRCFVTKIEAENPSRHLWQAIIHWTADHAYGTYFGAFATSDGRTYELGQVLWVTVADE